MNHRKVSATSYASPPRKMLMPLVALFFLITSGCICANVFMTRDNIDTDDFEDVHSAISPNIEWLFDEASRQFEGDKGGLYRAPESVYEECECMINLFINQFEEEDGTTYEVLFVYTSRISRLGKGYYYTPSGKLPPWAPEYGVVCSKHLGDNWYAFRTADSENPPSSESCPEDIQYP
jgi:hypothetical protein